ncbi:MAG: chemotaxis protein CheA [Firmicutes bacterium]|nr:chemotaxis protein CheA [Bacillota bacterium]
MKEFLKHTRSLFRKLQKVLGWPSYWAIGFRSHPSCGAVEAAPISSSNERAACFEIKIVLNPESPTKLARSMVILNNLKEIGEITAGEPDLETPESAPLDSFNLIFFTTHTEEDIRRVLSQSGGPDEFSFEIKPLSCEGKRPIEGPIDHVPDTANQDNPGQEVSSQAVSIQECVNEGPTADKIPTSSFNLSSPNQYPLTEEKTEGDEITSIRVNLHQVDDINNLVGELVIEKARLGALIGELLPALNEDETQRIGIGLKKSYDKLEAALNALRERTMGLRMLPIGSLFSRYKRLVRDLCVATGKKAELLILGDETTIDKSIIEEIADPLTHLIRNAIDHGIEFPQERLAKGKQMTAQIWLRAFNEGDDVVIEVEDDGVGIDIEKITRKALARGLTVDSMTEKEILSLIFLPGFSTSEKITDISGRGVGMDVVKTQVEKLRGNIEIITEKDKGTTFRVKLPLTLSIVDALLVNVMTETIAVPLSSIVEIVDIETLSLETMLGQTCVDIKSEILPVAYLGNIYGTGNASESHARYLLVMETRLGRVGLTVDALVGRTEIVIKTLSDYVGNIAGIGGATILGDGRVALIIDTSSLTPAIIFGNEVA